MASCWPAGTSEKGTPIGNPRCFTTETRRHGGAPELRERHRSSSNRIIPTYSHLEGAKGIWYESAGPWVLSRTRGSEYPGWSGGNQAESDVDP